MARRLNVNINDETAAALQELADEQGLNLTEIVRRSIGVYKFLNDRLDDKNVTLQLVDERTKERTQLALL